jgi:hypothetical protein
MIYFIAFILLVIAYILFATYVRGGKKAPPSAPTEHLLVEQDPKVEERLHDIEKKLSDIADKLDKK